MTCPHCRFSFETLKQMQENQEAFYTVAQHKKLLIADIDENARELRMWRPTGKLTWALDLQKLEEVHERIHSGELMLDRYEIDAVVPKWGTYVAALFACLGTDKVRQTGKI